MAASVPQLGPGVISPGAHGEPGGESGPGVARGPWPADPDGRWGPEQAIHARLVAAMEAERAHIARELHDVVGQALTAVRLNLLALDRHAAPGRATPIDASLAAVDDAIHQVRTAAFELRPSVLDDLGLAAALRALCRDTAARSSLSVTCRFSIGSERLPTEVETTVFRIAQEAVTNAVRHARAQHLQVSLTRRARTGRLVLEVRDDGDGFEPGACTAGRCLGIRGMAQRASLAGATLEVRSRPGEGTRVIVRCAWPGGDRPC